MEKRLGQPFFDGLYAGSVPRMGPQAAEQGLAWINDRFFPIRYEDEALPSVDWVLNVAKAAVLRYTHAPGCVCITASQCPVHVM